MERSDASPAGLKEEPAAIPDVRPARVAKTFSSLQHRNFQLWFGGQLISVIGTWMQIIAQGWLIYELTHSELYLGLVSFTAAIPLLIVSPWGGVISDRVPKRTLIIITQSIAMLLAFILSALTLTGVIQPWHILVMSAILGVVNAFDAPARQSFVVDMVGKEDMTNAIAINSMMFNGARVAGPALGGLLLSVLGAPWCFFLNGVSFLAVIAGLAAMRLPPHKIQRTNQRVWDQYVAGVRYSMGKKEILALITLAYVFSIFGLSYSALLPAFVDKSLHSDAAGFGAINALVGVGAFTGALVVARYGNSGHRGLIMLASNLIYPIILGIFAFNTQFGLALVLSFGLGLGFMLLLNTVNSLLQIHVSDEMRGRVMSLYTLSFFAFSPLGSLATGAIAESVPMNLTIGVSAALTFVLTLALYLANPSLRKMK